MQRPFPSRSPFRERRTHVTYSLRGDDLDPTAISSELGIAAHWGFARGEAGPDGIRHRWGVWGIGSWDLSDSEDPADHLSSLLGRLNPVLPKLEDLLETGGLSGSCWIVQRISPGRFGYSIDAASLRTLALVVSSVEISYLAEGFAESAS